MIRAVTAADCNEWLRMRCALWPDGGQAEHLQDIERFLAGDRREPAHVLLAFADDAAVGFAEISIRNIVDGCCTDRVAYLEGWYVVPESRRCGVGRALFEAAEEWAATQGCAEFGSDSEIGNEISRAAHRSLGFEETGCVRTYRKYIVR